MAEEKKKENPKGRVIVYADRMKVRAKEGALHLTPGKEYELHPVHAEKLIAKGYAEKIK